MQTKTEQVKQHLMGGNLKAALRIASKFRYQFTREQRRVLQIAYECATGRQMFYRQLGIDVTNIIDQAIVILQTI